MPFARLAHTHALSAGADAFFVVSLAGSLFFNVSADASQSRVMLYLALTMAPFAIVAPFVGPLVDQFSNARTAVIALTILGRGILCLFIAGDLQNVLFYPEAFSALVLGKAYSVAKSATVPALVDDPDELVTANARLSRLSAISGALGAGIAAGIMYVGEAAVVLRVGSLVYFAGAAVATLIPRLDEARTATPQVEHEEVHSPSVVIGASVVTALRAAVGFVTFLVAFGFKRAGEPTWLYGVAGVAVGVGGFLATTILPVIRRRWLSEERLFSVALLITALAALVAAWQFRPGAVVAFGGVLGFSFNLGRQAFDSVLQRDAPDAVRGRHFARFETRFQLAWVAGGLIPVVFSLPFRVGLVMLGVAFLFSLTAVLTGVTLEDRLARGLRTVTRR
jgi:MFS family permease